MTDIAITPEIVAEHGLTPDEYQVILSSLGREPNLTELGIFSVMWSEHCSSKSSRIHLGKLPTEAHWVIRGPGANRSEESRVGKECVSTCRYRWAQEHYKTKKKKTK